VGFDVENDANTSPKVQWTTVVGNRKKPDKLLLVKVVNDDDEHRRGGDAQTNPAHRGCLQGHGHRKERTASLESSVRDTQIISNFIKLENLYFVKYIRHD